ncbi:tripartite tricarboxylate transporter substrate binding protein [Cupriavidus basilensis]|uniref:Tripartite tricarboxylate transporter substrate binding protein n=1 Tax=Cupriavidus basilensis TaxID=68895 RepID=A0ABT6AIN3_9BURK|nr:tripartite tricarboxylate transporter substrate binding protein [Cupriavidus basilensis]MDF3832465.1 tripartite tricarboxylate transporter substrate binding protein [Cupriavidus basilensis]
MKLVVPFAPAGGNDVFARLIAQKVGEGLPQQIVVDNRPGGGGNIGSKQVAAAPADGYTLLLGHTGTLAINPALYANLGYDPQRDLTPVALIASTPLVLVVRADSPLRSVNDLIAAAKARPGTLNYASSGNGTGSHLTAVLFGSTANVKLEHVPYKGTGPALTDLVGGQVDLTFCVIPPVLQLIRSGKLRALAVTGAKRSVLLPNVPTVAQAALPGFESTLSYGILAPRGTPKALVDDLHARIDKVLRMPDVEARLRAEGAEPLIATQAEFSALMARESAKWTRVIQSSGVTAE